MSVHKMDGVDGLNNITIKKVRLYCTAAITAGQVVMIDTADTTNGAGFSVKKADVDDTPLAFGIALETLTAAGYLQIQYAGRCSLPTADGAISVGDNVGADTTVDGRIKAAASPTVALFPFAVCIDAYSDGLADGIIMINDKGWFE